MKVMININDPIWNVEQSVIRYRPLPLEKMTTLGHSSTVSWAF